MAATRAVAPTLSDQQLDDLLELIGDSDSVELKLTVPESQQYSVARGLGIDPLDAQIRQVYFFDTPELDLNRHGVVVRARRIQRKTGDSVVKARPVVPKDVPAKLRRLSGFGVEVDALPGSFVCSGRLKRSVDNADIQKAVNGDLPLGALFSKAQRAYLGELAPDGFALDELSVLGPIVVHKLKFAPEALGRSLVVELWTYPDGSRVLELSTKCAPGEAFQVAAESRVFLSRRGVDLSGEQQTKTLKALEFFSGRRAAGEAP